MEPQCSIEALGRTHGGLDVERLDVLPMLLQKRNEEVHGKVNVLHELVLRHAHIAHRHGQAKNLLHLELDGGFDVVDFANHVVLVGQHSWEFTSLVQTWAQKTWDLFDQGFRSKESIVLLGKLLDQFLEFSD